MAGRKKSEQQKITRNDIETHVKAFLQSGGEIVKIPKGESAFQKNMAVKPAPN